MAIQLAGSLAAMLFCIVACMCAVDLNAFAPLLTIAFLGIFLTSSPLCEPQICPSQLRLFVPWLLLSRALAISATLV